MKYHIPTKTSIFADISPVGATSYLLGLAKGNFYKFVGGGVKEGQTLEDALESEANEEASATFNRAHFGGEQFNLNLIIVHAKTLVYLVTPSKKLIRNPQSHRGPCELKIIVRCQEISGRTPQAGQELSNLGYFDSPCDLTVRNFVACASRQRQRMWQKVETTDRQPPTPMSRKHLRDKLGNHLFIDPDYMSMLLTSPPNLRGVPPPQQELRT